MKIKLKVIVLLVCAAFLLTACTGGGNLIPTTAATTQTAATTAQAAAATTAAAAAATEADAAEEGDGVSAYDEFVSFTMNTTADPPGAEDVRWNAYMEKFNFRVDWIPLQYSERFEKLRIWLATDDLPDITWIGLNEQVFAEYITWINTGLFAEIPDLAPYPNIRAMYDRPDMVADILCTFDDKLMTLPAIRGSAAYNYMVCLGYGYRADWAETLNMRAEDDVYSWDEFWNLIEAFITQDPGGNGQGNTYGISTRLTYFPDIFGIWQNDPYPWTWEDASYSAIDGQYVWLPATETFVEGLKIAKGLYDRGLIWPDNVVDTGETLYRELYYAGQMGAMGQNNEVGWVSDARNKTYAADESLTREKTYVVAKVSIPGTENEFYAHSMSCYWSGVAFSKKATDAQKTRFMETMEWNLSEEGKLHAQYGIEGTDYTIASDGTVTLNWEMDSSGTYVNPHRFSEYYSRLGLDDGAAGLNNVARNPLDVADSRALFEWNMKNIGDKIKVMDYIQVYTPIASKEVAGTFTTDVRNKMIDLMANSTVDKIEGEWMDWVETMLPKVQPVVDELNTLEFIPTEPISMMDFVRGGGIVK